MSFLLSYLTWSTYTINIQTTKGHRSPYSLNCVCPWLWDLKKKLWTTDLILCFGTIVSLSVLIIPHLTRGKTASCFFCFFFHNQQIQWNVIFIIKPLAKRNKITTFGDLWAVWFYRKSPDQLEKRTEIKIWIMDVIYHHVIPKRAVEQIAVDDR